MVAVIPRVEFARSRCTAFMPNYCQIRRGATTVYPVPSISVLVDPDNDGRCRVESSRGKRADVLSPADPMDANARSNSNYIIAIPEQFGIYIDPGDEWEDLNTGLILTVGDLIAHQSYEAEVRFVATKQRLSTVVKSITFHRVDDITGAETVVGTYDCQFAFDNNLPTISTGQTASGRVAYILGTLVIDSLFVTLRVQDRFLVDGSQAVITSILLQSPDRFEAIVQVAVGGA